MINKVTLIGRVGKDPEFRTTAGGTAMAKFSLATTETRKDKDGQKIEETSWHRCIAWSGLAEIIRDYVHKGSLLYVEGRISYGSYDKDGTKVYTTDIVVNELKMLGGKDKGESSSGSAPQPANDPPARREPAAGTGGGFEDDDLPF